jgi:hypothetical protein
MNTRGHVIRSLPLVLTVSLFANVVLVGLAWTTPSSMVGERLAHSTPALSTTPASSGFGQAPNPDETGGTERFIVWLRDTGLPPKAVDAAVCRLIVRALSEEERFRLARALDNDFWEVNSEPHSRWAALHQKVRAETDAMVAALGLPESKYTQLRREQTYGPVSTEKIALLESLVAKSPGNRDALLEQVLTAEERFEYEIRTSPRSKQLAHRLARAVPTEAEFRAIYRLGPALDEPAAHAMLRRILGEERVAALASAR